MTNKFNWCQVDGGRPRLNRLWLFSGILGIGVAGSLLLTSGEVQASTDEANQPSVSQSTSVEANDQQANSAVPINTEGAAQAKPTTVQPKTTEATAQPTTELSAISQYSASAPVANHGYYDVHQVITIRDDYLDDWMPNYPYATQEVDTLWHLDIDYSTGQRTYTPDQTDLWVTPKDYQGMTIFTPAFLQQYQALMTDSKGNPTTRYNTFTSDLQDGRIHWQLKAIARPTPTIFRRLSLPFITLAFRKL